MSSATSSTRSPSSTLSCRASSDGGRDTGRFLLNSTVGLGGLFDPATRIGLTENDEDFDQTLAVGRREGPYLVVPLFGPRTTRHAFGDLADAPLSPLVASPTTTSISLGLWVIYQVDARSRLLDADQQVFEAFDPYLFVRDAYLQNRRYRALDGNVPEDDSYLDDVDDWTTALTSSRDYWRSRPASRRRH